ncbi:putative endonuclease [Erwinia persicina]|jgi:putative endonuclease|uniref:GIY-YIG nuclease family protein n=2 Tax=Erwinia TaxID=551 RepID=A0ABV4ECK1_9GAMM|nr:MULTISPECIES: GIY-YIG nuclease family protein [Erwinia]MCP1439479.1 putative endonuclease [Erwinia persicina]MDN4625673.1 GIY-YIG nuclease family protein [Erwinia sp. PsM31]MDN8541435.1 GIY-YIG nuclease family protein [Erwinia sp. BC051422]
MATQATAPWHLYIVQTAGGALYTGITNDVPRRFKQHQAGTGAKALRGKGPLTLLFHCEAGDRASASRLEYRIKQLKRQEKIRLVTHQPVSLEAWLTDLTGG